jgi:hypothetical protein
MGANTANVHTSRHLKQVVIREARNSCPHVLCNRVHLFGVVVSLLLVFMARELIGYNNFVALTVRSSTIPDSAIEG